MLLASGAMLGLAGVLAACGQAATPTSAPAKPAEAPKPAAEAGAPKPTEAPKPAEAAKPTEVPKPAEAPKPAAEPTKPAPAAAAPAPAKKGGVVKLLETPSATVQAMNDDYTKKTGVKIEAEVIPQGVDSTAKLIASFNAGGSDYDAVRVDVIDLALYAASNWIDDVSAKWPKETQEDLLPFAKQAVTYKGKWYGMPKDSEWKTWIYNEKLLKDAGVAKAPESWEEYVAASKAVQGKGLAKFGQTWGWTQGENIACDYPALVASLGGKYIDEGTDELLINKDAGVQALQFMVDWTNVDKIVDPASLTAKNVNSRDAQAAGDAVFGLHWGTPLAVLNDPAKSKVVNQCKMGLVPHKAGGPSWTVSGPECWAISKGSKNKDDAWDYLVFRQGKDGSKRQFLGEGTVFGWKSLFDDPEVKAFATKSQIDFDVAKKQADNIVNRPMLPWYHEYSAALQLELQNALTQQKKPQPALNDAVEAYNKIKQKATGR
jgi:multiple sugar transport system substrate-binding protein